MTGSSKIRLVTFDAMNTLIRLKEPVGVVYHRLACEQNFFENFKTIDDAHKRENLLHESFLKIYRKFSKESPCFGYSAFSESSSPALCNKKWWTGLVEEIFQDAFSQQSNLNEENLKITAENLYEHYRTTTPWVFDSSAVKVLKRLKIKGISMGVISNYDTRLREILRNFEIFQFFQAFALSGELGFEKPSPKIFEFMRNSIRVFDGAEILHIGDNYDKDYLAAKNVGWNAALFAPKKDINNLNVPIADVFKSFDDLIRVV